MTTTARPLLHAMALVAATLLGGWLGLSLFSTLWIGAALLAILLSYVGLVTGLIVIPRRTNRGSSEKVFCIGFSRTGTTS